MLVKFFPQLTYLFGVRLQNKPLPYEDNITRHLIDRWVPQHHKRRRETLIVYDFVKKNCSIATVRWYENTTLSFFTPSLFFDHIFMYGIYDVNEIMFLKSILRKGDVFVDAGANCGMYTIFASKIVGKAGRVFAFEPSTREYKFLLLNIHQNKCNNVRAYN
ncbi:MAG: FkbM family methyltransferase, partial [Planctomycetota bacterium]